MKETFATSYRSMKEYAVAFASDEDSYGIAIIFPPRYFYRLMKYEFHAAKIRKNILILKHGIFEI